MGMWVGNRHLLLSETDYKNLKMGIYRLKSLTELVLVEAQQALKKDGAIVLKGIKEAVNQCEDEVELAQFLEDINASGDWITYAKENLTEYLDDMEGELSVSLEEFLNYETDQHEYREIFTEELEGRKFYLLLYTYYL